MSWLPALPPVPNVNNILKFSLSVLSLENLIVIKGASENATVGYE